MKNNELKRIQQFETHFGEEEKKELLDVIDSGWFVENKKTREFEKIFAQFVGRKYAVASTSGTIALFLALKVFDLKNTKNVIVPDLTFVASPNAVMMANSKVSLVDISKQDLGLDLKKTNSMIDDNTQGIMPVDFNGRSPDMVSLKEIADKHNLFIVEDACHIVGSYYNGKHMGHYCDLGVFSLSTPKIISTGQGGMIVTDNEEHYERLRMLKDFGRDIDKKHNMKLAFDHVIIGYNFKFTEFQAALGIAQMKKLPTRINHKKRMFELYQKIKLIYLTGFYKLKHVCLQLLPT